MNVRFALLAGISARAFDNPPAGYQPTPEQVAQVRENRRTTTATGSDDPMMKRDADSAYMLPYWEKIDAIIEGIEGMRNAGGAYLPRFNDESDSEYQARLKMTKMTNVFRDIVEDLSSKPFQEEAKICEDDGQPVPPELEEFEENVDGSGNNLSAFANDVFFNGIAGAVDWIMIDYPKRDPNIRTVAEMKAAGMRPSWSRVLGRNVLCAKSIKVNGAETLTYIKIYEPGSPDHIREFLRDPATGAVSWRLWVKTETVNNETGSRFAIEDEGQITIDVIPMVPFATGRRDGIRFRWLPALKDAADLQIELYQQESGLKFAKNLTAYPMLAANGIRPLLESDGKTPKRISVGPNRVLYAPPDGNGNVGNWAYLEPSASSLTFLQNDVKDTIEQLRELGRQPLTAQSGNLTVITTAVAAGKANSAVKQWALMLKNALENAIVITCKWLGIPPETYDAEVFVYTDFEETSDGKDVDALDKARERKDISRETYWSELQRRGILSPEFDHEREEERLLEEMPGDGVDTSLDDNDPAGDNPGQVDD